MIPFIDLQAQYNSLHSEMMSSLDLVLRHQKFINGPECQELERRLQDLLGVGHGVLVSSGTDALLCALMAAGVGVGDEVITSALSFASTVEAILLLGATPVYVDCRESHWNLDISKVEPLISERTKAVLAVSLYGCPVDLLELRQLCHDRGLLFIEDASQSLGAEIRGSRSAAVADMSVASLFPTKPLGAAGNLGVITTNDEAIHQRLMAHRCHGQSKKYHHSLLGWNAMPSTLQAASLLPQMSGFDRALKSRQRLATRYHEKLSADSSFQHLKLPVLPEGVTSSWCYYAIQLEGCGSAERDQVIQRCFEMGLQLLIHYPHILPDNSAFSGRGRNEDQLVNARQRCAESLSLPLYQTLSEEIQDRILAILKSAL